MRKKIIITHEFAPFRGGAATYCAEIARAASEAGHPCEIWTAGDPAQETETVRRCGGRVSLKIWELAPFGWGLWKRRREWIPGDLVLGSVGAQMLFIFFDVLGASFPGAAPVFHGSEILRYQRHAWLRFFARRWLATRRRIFTTSEYTRCLLLESGLLRARQQVEVSPCAMRRDLFEASRTTPLPPHHEGTIRVLTLARLHPRKGHLDTVAALALLPPEVRQRLVYQVGGAGDPSYLVQIETACVKAGVPFEYLGEIPEENMAATYAQCDLYVMSSRALEKSVEGFGLTYLEAGCFGKPVVGYRTGGVAEAVREGESGLLVEEGNIAQLSQALLRLVEDPELRQKLGQGGRAHAAERTWAKAASVLFPSA